MMWLINLPFVSSLSIFPSQALINSFALDEKSHNWGKPQYRKDVLHWFWPSTSSCLPRILEADLPCSFYALSQIGTSHASGGPEWIHIWFSYISLGLIELSWRHGRLINALCKSSFIPELTDYPLLAIGRRKIKKYHGNPGQLTMKCSVLVCYIGVPYKSAII